jgi:hypothetical protein
MLHISNIDTLKAIYLAYFHTLMKYGIILVVIQLTVKKKAVRIMMGVKSCNSCGDLFKRLQILTLFSEYLYSLINFITNNEEHFQMNADVHSVNVRHKHCLHKPTANSSCFQKSAQIKIFSNLPYDLKCLMSEKV